MVPGPALEPPPPLVPVPPPVPAVAVPAASLAAEAGELLPDALVAPDPPDEHPANAAAAIAAVAETPGTNLILFTGKTPIGVPFSFFRHPLRRRFPGRGWAFPPPGRST